MDIYDKLFTISDILKLRLLCELMCDLTQYEIRRTALDIFGTKSWPLSITKMSLYI